VWVGFAVLSILSTYCKLLVWTLSTAVVEVSELSVSQVWP